MIAKLQGTSTILPSGVAGAGGISTQTVRVDSLSLITSTAPPKKESGGLDGCRIAEAGICHSMLAHWSFNGSSKPHTQRKANVDQISKCNRTSMKLSSPAEHVCFWKISTKYPGCRLGSKLGNPSCEADNPLPACWITHI